MNETVKFIVNISPDLEDIIPEYIADVRSDIMLLRTSMEKVDWETIQTVGHQLKGSGGGYGFDRFTQIGSAMEEAAKKTDMDELAMQLNELEDYFERLELVYKD